MRSAASTSIPASLRASPAAISTSNACTYGVPTVSSVSVIRSVRPTATAQGAAGHSVPSPRCTGRAWPAPISRLYVTASSSGLTSTAQAGRAGIR
jgi:hypothetical protein